MGRELPWPDSAALLAQQLAGPGSTPSQHLAHDELARRVRETVARLPDLDREVLVMRTFEGLSYAEVAYVLEIEPAAKATLSSFSAS